MRWTILRLEYDFALTVLARNAWKFIPHKIKAYYSICDTPRIHPSLPYYTPPFKHLSATLSVSTSHFSTTLYDALKIYPSLPEYTPLFKHLYVTRPESTPPFQNMPPPFSTTLCDAPRILPFLPESALLSYNVTIPESTPTSQIIPPFKHPCATLPESTPPRHNISPFLTSIYDAPRI